MISVYQLKPRFQNLLRPGVQRLYQRGITANQVTLAACLLSLLVGALVAGFASHLWLFALVPLWMFLRMALNAVGTMVGASRRYDGPMGKSDRALCFGVIGAGVASGLLPLAWIDWLMLLIAALLLLTIGNRVRQGLAELAASRRGSDGQA
ncbi:CDP-alcohol phosphatidyltransferase family protein [Pseudomonas aeruginosa]|nr:CDP-alcohol phosphatidyltransferase family protein [Pseudomonas aeruginosa]